MDTCDLMAFITGIACAIRKCSTYTELKEMAVIFSQLGDTLVAMVAREKILEDSYKEWKALNDKMLEYEKQLKNKGEQKNGSNQQEQVRDPVEEQDESTLFGYYGLGPTYGLLRQFEIESEEPKKIVKNEE